MTTERKYDDGLEVLVGDTVQVRMLWVVKALAGRRGVVLGTGALWRSALGDQRPAIEVQLDGCPNPVLFEPSEVLLVVRAVES